MISGLNELQQDLVETLSEYANVIVLLGGNSSEHIFFTYTTFDGANRSNIGSIEYNSFRGINITKFIKNSLGMNSMHPTALISNYQNYIGQKTARNVKYANIPYLIFGTE
jgi:hypothetical protein